MAERPMEHFTVDGVNIFEVTDAKARQDVSNLKDDITQVIDSVYVTDTASGSIASFSDGAHNVLVKSLKVNIEPVQSGSGDPSPTNIRPISGHTQAVVTRTGKNFLALPMYYRSSLAVPELFFLPKGTYFIHFTVSGATSWRTGIWMKDKDGNNLSDAAHKPTPTMSWYSNPGYWMSGADGTLAQTQINIVDDCYVRFFYALGDVTSSTVFNSQMLNAGTSIIEYEEPHVQTVTFDLGNTIYGGTLDVGTGVMTVDRAMVDLGSLTWNTTSNRAMSTGISSLVKIVPSSSVPNAIASKYKAVSASTTINSGTFAIDASGMLIFFYNGEMPTGQLVYELAEPLTVQLTANELKTLLGQNNIWSDAGDVKVEYRADTKLYIEKLTAPTEDDLIVDHAISENSFFMVGNTLYRATTAIASGATITVGTNATKLSLSDALNALA